MTERSSSSTEPTQHPNVKRSLPPATYARLKAEAIAPYRGLRLVIYTVFGASGAIGAFVFLTQLLAGQEVSTVLPNLGIQLGVIALMVWLFRLEQRPKRK